jgi:hypothetical protein
MSSREKIVKKKRTRLFFRGRGERFVVNWERGR